MRFFHAIALSARYLFGHFRKYLFLFIALSFGFAFITVITSLSAGMRDAVFQAAQLHYGGDLFVLGFDRSPEIMIHVKDGKAVDEAIAISQLNPQAVLYRTNCFETAALYFNGKAVRQKNVFGVDWDAEASLFDAVDMSRGEDEEVNLDGGDTIIISAPVAKLLGAKIGDTVLLQVDTLTGQKTAPIFESRALSAMPRFSAITEASWTGGPLTRFWEWILTNTPPPVSFFRFEGD